MTPRVLHAGVDTLEVSFSGIVAEDVAEALDSKKAGALDSPLPHHLGPTEVFVQGKAWGFWRWRLTHPEFSVVARRVSDRNSVSAQVRFSAFGLANRSLEDLWAFARFSLSFLGDFKPMSVSRCDVYADFQGWEPTPADLAGIVCAAEYRATHGTEGNVQTFQYGKGDVVMRVYNKTAEMLVSGKRWLTDVWGQSEEYDPEAPVWRVEIQLRRKALSELGVNCVEEVIAAPGALLDFGLGWAQLRVPSNDLTKTRWPEDPKWTALRKAVFGGVPLGRSTRPSQLMDLDRAKRQLIGLAATAAVYFETDDYMGALQQLSFASEAHMMREKMDFAALREEKRRRVLSGRD